MATDAGSICRFDRQRGASMPIFGATAAKWRTFQVMIVEARAFSAHAAMSMSYVCPPITPLRCALRSARQVSAAVRCTTGVRPVGLQQRDGVRGSQTIRSGQAREDRVGFRQRMSGKHKFFAAALASLDLGAVRAWCSCQEQTVATRALVSQR